MEGRREGMVTIGEVVISHPAPRKLYIFERVRGDRVHAESGEAVRYKWPSAHCVKS